MAVNSSIRALFKPYQPSIAFSAEKSVRYEEFVPKKSLEDFIFCYWRLNTPRPLANPFKYRVVSDGCIDILFEQGALESVFATGFSAKYLEYELGHSFDYLGIRFLPTGFPGLFDYSAHQLTNEFLPLGNVLPDFYQLFQNYLNGPVDLEQASELFNELFELHLSQRSKPPLVDRRLQEAMKVILQSGGSIPLSELDVGLSERQLRRLFEFYFGESPKTFARIIRFQNILGAKPSVESLKNNKIFYDEGYYDQAHFIKEFKAFYGVTPNKAFGR